MTPQASPSRRTRVLIMGAAGRDFHNFNVVYRDRADVEVVAFTATQIPNIEGRTYPPQLAGSLYPNGIPIHDESELGKLISSLEVDDVVFAYSDVPHTYVMHKACEVQQLGANFVLLGGRKTMLKSSKPVIAVGAVRTGSGKSQTSRRVAEVLKKLSRRVAVIRHPMPYGDLALQTVQRFESIRDLALHRCTIEEMEEYEPHVARGSTVYAGVDYEAILRDAEQRADAILWDGGNNDLPFYLPDLFIVVADPHRPGHELNYFPGETNLRMADVVVINKVDTADPEGVRTVRESIARVNPNAVIIAANSPITVSRPELIRGKRVVAVEDGPTLTHGEMKYGAAVVAASRHGASAILDPRPWVVGSIRETFQTYPNIGALLPAMGYGEEQIRDLEATLNAVECDTIVIGTPIDLGRILTLNKPAVRVTYDLEEIGHPDLEDVIRPILAG